jgi:hypothetical protein
MRLQAAQRGILAAERVAIVGSQAGRQYEQKPVSRGKPGNRPRPMLAVSNQALVSLPDSAHQTCGFHASLEMASHRGILDEHAMFKAWNPWWNRATG